jgi:hypothetical protein
MPLKFELLCIDQQEKVKYTKPKHLLRDLSISESLWKSEPVISEDSLELYDNRQNINVSIQPFDTSKMVTGDRFSSAYYIIVEGEFDNLEPFRIKLIDQLKNSGFNHRQILIDDVSNKIAIDIYPQEVRISEDLEEGDEQLIIPPNSVTAISNLMRYILAPSSLAGRGLGAGFLFRV